MARDELTCPVCSTDIPLQGDEHVGEEILCPVCHVTSRILKKRSSDDDESEHELEADW